MTTICCIGDSLTEGDYGVYGKQGIANVQTENYPYFLQQRTNAKVINLGKCGYTACAYRDAVKRGGIVLPSADIYIIMLGTNGNLTCNDGNADFYAYNELIALCREAACNATIVLCTPPHCTDNTAYSNCGYLPKVRLAAKAVEKLAKDNRLAMIDVCNCDSICEETTEIYQSNDGLHFNADGYSQLADIIMHGICKFL